MRTAGAVVALVLVLLPIPASARGPRFVRCCVELEIPEVLGPVCVQVHGLHGIRPRRACRFLGGRPMGQGDCSLALCRPGPA